MFPCEEEFKSGRCSLVRKSGGCSHYQTEYSNNFSGLRGGCQQGPTEDNEFLECFPQYGIPLTPYYSQSCLLNIGIGRSNGPTVYIEPYWTSFCTSYAACPNQCQTQNCGVNNCQPSYPADICPKCHHADCQQHKMEKFPQSVWVNYTINPYAGCISVQNTCCAETPPCVEAESAPSNVACNAEAVKAAEEAFWDKYYKQICEVTKPRPDEDSCTESEEEEAPNCKVPALECKLPKKRKVSKSKTKKSDDECKKPKRKKKRRSKSSPPCKSNYTTAIPFKESYPKPTNTQCVPCPEPTGYPPQSCPLSNNACRYDGKDDSTCNCHYGTEQFLCTQRLNNEPHTRRLYYCSQTTRVPRYAGCGSCGNKGCLTNPYRIGRLKSSRSASCNCTCRRNF